MSSEDDNNGCEFGHVFAVNGDHKELDDEWDSADVGEAVKKGEIEDLEDIKEATGADNYFLRPIMGDHLKSMKVTASGQGTPHTFILAAADKFDDDLEWDTALSEERIYISPQSEFHNDYLQKKQQAEQSVKQAMQGLEQLKKQKHMLQHDIRKLRSRVEDLREGEEPVLKGDFVQLVDGAGAGGGGQGADEQSMRFLRDNNFYPTIVSDFYEMDSLDDLKTAEQKARESSDKTAEDFEDGKLADLPENEKAILKKKYTMYEKWKDMFGSEVEKRLEELKGELKRVERAIEEQERSVKEPVRDMIMINQKSQEQLKDDFGRYFTYQRHSTEFKEFEFIARQGVKKEEGDLVEVDDEEATHFKMFYLHAVHVNIAGAADPRTPQEGPTVGKVFWFPALVCEHVFENIFQEKIDHLENRFEEVIEDYTGDFETEEGKEFKEKREDEGLSVRELKNRIAEEVEEKEDVSEPPLEFSSTIRRIEDGFDSPEIIKEQYEDGDEYLEAINDILGTSYGEEEENDYNPVTGLNKSLKGFFGFYDEHYLPDPDGNLKDMDYWFRFNYYYDLKKGLGLYTMK